MTSSVPDSGPVDLDAVRALLAGATAGPWEVFEPEWDSVQYRTVVNRDGTFTLSTDHLDAGSAALIAAAPSLLSAMADELAGLRAEVARVSGERDAAKAAVERVRAVVADEVTGETEAIYEHHAGNDGPAVARAVLAALGGSDVTG